MARDRETGRHEEPDQAKEEQEQAASGFPEPLGDDPGDISGDPTPHHSLSNPVTEPDPTEWPDPYESRDDPRAPSDDGEQSGEDQPHPPSGSTSTSEPHPAQDPEVADRGEAPKRDKLDQ
jgi:hypothetical protein